jgi:hypothetical protein
MSSLTLGGLRCGGLAISAACALALGLAASPARAGDDGEAPLWVGLGSVVGLAGQHDDVTIDYRDRAKLVVPPKVELPPPVASPTQGSGPWPRDPDIERAKKEKAEKDKYVFVPFKNRRPWASSPDSVVTVSATAGQDPDERPCNAGPGVACQTRSSPSINWNPLTWVGVQKNAPTVLGPEPNRDWLTDPPKGYREPAEGEGVRVAN